jgi:hypothetical protein
MDRTVLFSEELGYQLVEAQVAFSGVFFKEPSRLGFQRYVGIAGRGRLRKPRTFPSIFLRKYSSSTLSLKEML